MTLRPLTRVIFMSLALALAVPAAVSACSDTKTITSTTPFPLTINSGGAWCLAANRNWASTTGSAITIAADDVVLDLGGYRLNGSGAGAGTLANGVYALDQSNITIRNGVIRGFYQGILLDDDSGGGTLGGPYRIEDLLLQGNTRQAIIVKGQNAVITGNRILETGGTTVVSNDVVMGVSIPTGSGAVISNNVIRDFNPVGNGEIRGIWVSGDQAVVEHNVIGNSQPLTNATFGIRVYWDLRVLILSNRIEGLTNGIWTETPSGPGPHPLSGYRDNVALGCTVPYTGPAANLGNNVSN